ncbi:MAG: class A beta-lactamase-related serine hydrolase [Actinobacteria bacterium]|nr:class A beta-lactamase-related serine hydrolase [Actinomycetota bacterium]
MRAFELLDTWPVDNVSAAVIDRNGEIHYHGDESREFRLASVTKVITAWAVLVACEEGTVSLDDEVGAGGCTLRHLLAHAGGYPFDGDSPVGAVGAKRIYSNTGYELAAAHLAERSEMEFWQYVDEAVFAPLGIAASPQSGSAAKDARLDIVNLALFVAEIRRPRLVSRDTYVEAVTPQFADLEGIVPGVGRFNPCPWGLGPELRGTKTPHWTSPKNSAATYGHFGGSGTFVWVDPIADVACAVLTGREFDEWALAHWPDFSTAVLDDFRR